MSLTFIFLDGTGLGKKDKSNPFYSAKPEILKFWEGSEASSKNYLLKPVDPLMGIYGMPQSATGQTTIFTGINIPKLLGKHTGSFPNRLMRKILIKKNLFKKIREKRWKGVYINAYPMHSRLFSSPNIEITESGLFEFSESFPRIFKKKISVTTTMMIANGIVPFDVEDIEKERALFQDYTNISLIERGLKIDKISPKDAGRILNKISRNHHFSLYEYFQTDLYGHRRTFEERVKLIQNLDQLIDSFIQFSDPLIDTLLITSDHGNIEDSSSKTHTKNPVPLLVWGKNSEKLIKNIRSLKDISPAILNFLSYDLS